MAESLIVVEPDEHFATKTSDGRVRLWKVGTDGWPREVKQ